MYAGWWGDIMKIIENEVWQLRRSRLVGELVQREKVGS